LPAGTDQNYKTFKGQQISKPKFNPTASQWEAEVLTTCSTTDVTQCQMPNTQKSEKEMVNATYVLDQHRTFQSVI
jgi:hypothetical protein